MAEAETERATVHVDTVDRRGRIVTREGIAYSAGYIACDVSDLEGWSADEVARATARKLGERREVGR